jgi:two-component system, NtrC family, response regulator HydG
MPSVLIVDDLSAIHEMLAAVIQPTGYEMAFATDGGEALGKYKAEPVDVVLADISMQPMDGITLLQELKVFDPDCVVIMMTGYASTETAVKALKYGAFDYIQKPFKIDELIQTLKRAVDFRIRSRGSHTDLEDSTTPQVDLGNRFVGPSRKIQRIRQQTAKLMGARAPILIHGERGTGKKKIAELVHEGSSDSQGPFMVIDCTARDEPALKAGLIGNGQGGDWVVRAKGGTLFLQHVESLPLPFQRALVGVIKCTINDTRIICGTQVDLEELVEEGKFDDELFYRIAALPMNLPPLREHLEDLPALVKYFVGKAKNPGFEGSQIEFTADAMEALATYSWPGNLTEFGQLVTSLASSTESRLIDASQLPLKLSGLEDWPNLQEHLAKEEASYIRRVLRACGGDKEKAAGVLGCEVDKVDKVEQATAEQAVV